MIKKKLPKYYLFISISTLIAIIFVVVQNTYSNLMGPIKAAKAGTLTKPINPNLNTEIIDVLENKAEYNSDQIGDIWYRATTPTPTLQPTPTLSAQTTPQVSPIISPTPVQTQL